MSNNTTTTRAASLLLSESGSLERRDSGPRDCPCFVKREVSFLAGRRSFSHKGQAGPTFRRSE
jgi:hypothetical protein